jgi:MFS family permease
VDNLPQAAAIAEPQPVSSAVISDATPTPEQERGMSSAIWGQCSGYIAQVAFGNGLILLYLNSRHISSSNILILLALPELFVFFVNVPCSYWCDRLGSKRIGIPGLFLNVVGFACLPLSVCFDGVLGDVLIWAGIAIYSTGFGLFSSGWYALLIPLVPTPMRGRFFGRLRFSWQLVGVIFGGLCTLALTENSPGSAFQLVLGVLWFGLILRIFFYSRIPQLDKPRPGPGFRRALAESILAPGYLSFCCYIFMLSLFTQSCPNIFTLIQKEKMHFGDREVVWLNTTLMVGSMFGFLLGGRAVDRLGTKLVFLVCHFALGAILILFLLRDHVPLPPVIAAGTFNYFLGLALAASNIAISTETLALLPSENKALAVSVSMMLYNGGKALSGLLGSWALKLGMLQNSWTLLGSTMSAYDTLLLLSAVMIVLLVVTLGLVPSVVRKAEWIPK